MTHRGTGPSRDGRADVPTDWQPWRIEDHTLCRHFRAPRRRSVRQQPPGQPPLELAQFTPGGKPVIALHATSPEAIRHRQPHRASLQSLTKPWLLTYRHATASCCTPTFRIGDAAIVVQGGVARGRPHALPPGAGHASSHRVNRDASSSLRVWEASLRRLWPARAHTYHPAVAAATPPRSFEWKSWPAGQRTAVIPDASGATVALFHFRSRTCTSKRYCPPAAHPQRWHHADRPYVKVLTTGSGADIPFSAISKRVQL